MIPLRLLDAGSSEERRLLQAAKCDGPDPAFRQKLLGAVGVLAVPVAPVATAPGATTHAVHAAPSAGWSASFPTGFVLVKWVGIAGFALSVGVGSGFAAGSAWANKRMESASASAAIRADMVPQAAAAEAVKAASIPAVSPVATPPRIPARTLVTRASPLPPMRGSEAEAEPGVTNEVHLVDEARAALRRGDGATCLRLINERQRRVRNGVLGLEAALVRIEALKLLGDSAAVHAEGERFLEQHPSGPLAARVRTILDD